MEVTSNPGSGRSDSDAGLQNRAQETTAEVRRVAKEKAGDVRAEVRERTEGVKEEVRERVEEKKHVASEKVHALARALRAAGDTLDDEGENRLARYGRQAASQVERLASHIDSNDTNGVMREIENIARDNPAAFTGGTFAAGLLLGRFLRSSRPDDADPRPDDTGRGKERAEGDLSRGWGEGSSDTTGAYGADRLPGGTAHG